MATQTSKYGVGDKVVHPQHGAATITKRLKQEFGGKKMDYFVLSIATEQLTVMVPVDKVEELIRPVELDVGWPLLSARAIDLRAGTGAAAALPNTLPLALTVSDAPLLVRLEPACF